MAIVRVKAFIWGPFNFKHKISYVMQYEESQGKHPLELLPLSL